MKIATTTHINKPKVAVTRASSSLHSAHGEKLNEGSSLDSSIPTTTEAPTSSSITWPIFVRLSNNGQDITIQVPIEPPYLTVAGLRKELLPHLENNTSLTRVKLIYLGRILPDQHVIVPTANDADVPLPPPKNRAIQIQKEGVIQAMVTNISL